MHCKMFRTMSDFSRMKGYAFYTTSPSSDPYEIQKRADKTNKQIALKKLLSLALICCKRKDLPEKENQDAGVLKIHLLWKTKQYD